MVYQMGLRGNKRFVALSLLRSRCERPKSWATANRRGTSTKCPESAPDPHRSHVGDFRLLGFVILESTFAKGPLLATTGETLEEVGRVQQPSNPMPL